MIGWRILFWSVLAYILFTIVYFFVKSGKSSLLKRFLQDLRRYVFGYMELEKLYVDKVFESGIENNLSKIEIRDKYRKAVKEKSESIKIIDFPTDDVLKKIRKQISKIE